MSKYPSVNEIALIYGVPVDRAKKIRDTIIRLQGEARVLDMIRRNISKVSPMPKRRVANKAERALSKKFLEDFNAEMAKIVVKY